MRYAVIGGGIAGLAAAWELTSRQPDASVLLFEPGPVGGKIRTSAFEGRPVDEGPDAFLTRVPEAVRLCEELGLAGDLVAPAAGSSMVWWAGRLRPLPPGLVLGVPGRLSAIARSGILSPRGALRAGLDLVLPRSAVGADVSVHDLVARRFGREVALRLVDPLVGGIHAGRTDELSARATVPQLVAAAEASRSLLLALRRSGPGASAGPVFLTPRQGVGALVERLAGALLARGVAVVPAAAASVDDAGEGRLDVEGERVDGVVVATPAPSAAALLERLAPDGAAGLRTIDHATVAMVTMAWPASALPVPEGINGFLVPRSSGRLMTACSFASSKWPHWSEPGSVVVRVSSGRWCDERSSALDDGDLTGRLVEELGDALGRRLPAPRQARVTRWPGAFPQYAVGHPERVAAIERAVQGAHPGVALAGAAYRGSGIPACIGSGRRAAAALLARAPSST